MGIHQRCPLAVLHTPRCTPADTAYFSARTPKPHGASTTLSPCNELHLFRPDDLPTDSRSVYSLASPVTPFQITVVLFTDAVSLVSGISSWGYMAIRSIDPVEQPIYDKRGMPLAYLGSDGVIYRFNGRPVAYVLHSTIWTFSGQAAGWLEKGWIRTVLGGCIGALASADTHAGPALAPRKQPPHKIEKRSPAAFATRKSVPVRPSFNKRWCRTPLELFLSWLSFGAGE